MRNPSSGPIFAPILLGVLLALGAAAPVQAAIEIIGPRVVLERYVVEREDRTFLRIDGREWELVTDPSSPLVSQLGDGAFHPMEPTFVRAALRDLGPGLRPADGRVFVLPFPRRELIESSCEGHDVFLTPGIREVSEEHVHATVAHEIGHLVQHSRIPEGSRLWNEYVELRGLGDDPRFHARAPHRDRPREIFAEDYRFLMGGLTANYSGRIENPDLTLPSHVPGLEAWFDRAILRPVAHAIEEPEPVSYPNPFDATLAGLLEVRFQGGHRVHGTNHADVIDLNGRRVCTLSGSPHGISDVSFSWDGRDRSGAPVASGIYFVRWSERPEAGTARVQILR